MWLIGYDNQRTCRNAKHTTLQKLYTTNGSNSSHLHFCMPLNLDAYPTFRFGKTVRRNPTSPMADHKNKWESVGLINDYCVVGVSAIPYPGYGVIINIIDKDDITSRISRVHTSQNVLSNIGKYREMGVLQTSLLCV